MRCCILLTGLARSFELSYIFNKYFIIDPLDCDVFIHTWDIVNGGFRFSPQANILNTGRVSNPTNEISLPCFESTLIDFINNKKINCKKSIIESYENFKNLYGPESTPAQLYSWKSCNDLKKQYEIENNFEYDLVIKTRNDLLPYTSIPDDEIKNINNTLYITNHISKGFYDKHISDLSAPDGFAFSNSKLMNYYCDAFDTWINNKQFKNEALLGYHLNKNNINYSYTNIKLKMMEVYTENEWYAVRHTNP